MNRSRHAPITTLLKDNDTNLSGTKILVKIDYTKFPLQKWQTSRSCCGRQAANSGDIPTLLKSFPNYRGKTKYITTLQTKDKFNLYTGVLLQNSQLWF